MSSFVLNEETSSKVGELVPASDLGIDFTEPDALSYLTTPLHIFRSEIEGKTRFEVVSSHEPLRSEALVEILNEVAPIRRDNIYAYADGIIDDWDIVDKARTKDDHYTRLVGLHSLLGGPWEEFLKSRGRLLSVLIGGRFPNTLRPQYGDPKLVKGSTIDYEMVVAEISRAKRSSLDILISALDGTGIVDAKSLVFKGIKNTVNTDRPLHKHIKDNDKSQKYYESVDYWRRRVLVSRILLNAKLNEEQQDAFTKSATPQLFETILDTPDDKFLYPKVDLKEGALDTHNPTVIQRGIYKATQVELRLADGKRRHAIVPETIHTVEEPPKVSPLLSWERDEDGNRKFIIEREKEHKESLHFKDGTLGVLLAAYFAPEVRENWPRRMKIRNRSQGMGAAQVPVLALMRKAELLQTDFTQAVEAF